nr:MAG TPA: hypothetical protein [Caudoviricetes sp.]
MRLDTDQGPERQNKKPVTKTDFLKTIFNF